MGTKSHSTARRWYLDYVKNGVAGLQYKKGIKAKISVDISEPMKKKLTNSEREEFKSIKKVTKYLSWRINI